MSKGYRSQEVVDGADRAGMRAHLKAIGVLESELERPFIGVVNSWNEMHPGHQHLRELAVEAKKGILAGGGVPFEFNTIALCDGLTHGHQGMCFVLPSRELIADSIEVMAEGQRLDGLLFIGSCDKIVPGMLMALFRLNIPSIFLTGGPMLPGCIDGEEYAIYEIREAVGKYKRGQLTSEEMKRLEENICPTAGSCSMMGTANTMSCVAEVMGLTLPGVSTTHAPFSQKRREAKESGMRIVELVEQGMVPGEFAGFQSLENAVRVVMATGGSTNSLLHLPAIAREMGCELHLDDFEKASRETPCLLKVKPSGRHTMLDFDRAGGIPVVMKELENYLDLEVNTVAGKTWKEIAAGVENQDPRVIAPGDRPHSPHGGIAVLRGNLAPDGAVVKTSAVAESMLVHSGPARVFDSQEDAVEAILEDRICPGEVIVIRYEGPRGGPGMREMLAATSVLVGTELGETTALITDGRFSGATRGPCVGHISPEAALNGPIAALVDGDMISIDIPNRRIDFDLDSEEIERRLKNREHPKPEGTGYLARYSYLVGGVNRGAVLRDPKELREEGENQKKGS